MFRILEAGCGSSPLHWQGEMAEYTAVEPRFANAALHQAVDTAMTDNPAIAKHELLAIPLEELPPAYGEFDLVFASNILGSKHTLHERLPFVQTALKRVAPMGKLVVVDYVTTPVTVDLMRIVDTANGQGYDAKLVKPADQGFGDLWKTYMSKVIRPARATFIVAELQPQTAATKRLA